MNEINIKTRDDLNSILRKIYHGNEDEIWSPFEDCIWKIIQENKQLKEALEIKSYCKYANKCNETYDCSKEEYNDMCEANMKLLLDNDELKEHLKQRDEVIDEAIKYIYDRQEQGIYENHNLLGILQKYKGDNK